MAYKKDDLTYEKRPLTKDIALKVITKSIPANKEDIANFTKLAFPYKSGESAAQVDSCPVAKLEELHGPVRFLKQKYEGFRIRHAQLSGIAAINDTVGNISDDTAEYLIASGSIAVIAKGYEGDTDKKLLKNGILPLVSEEDIKTGEFVFIRNIRSEENGIKHGKLEAYTVTSEKQLPVNIGIREYSAKELEKIL